MVRRVLHSPVSYVIHALRMESKYKKRIADGFPVRKLGRDSARKYLFKLLQFSEAKI